MTRDLMGEWLRMPAQQRLKILKKAMPQPTYDSLCKRMASMNEDQMTPIQRDAVIHLMGGK